MTRSRRSASRAAAPQPVRRRSGQPSCRRGSACSVVAVVAQEQLLQRRRLAGQAAHAGRGRAAAARRRARSCRPRSAPGRRRRAGRARRAGPARPSPAAQSAVIEVRVRCRSSASVPVSTVRPARMMLTRSQSASTSARMWLDSRTVRPASRGLGDAPRRNTSSISGSSPEVGSSSRSSSTSDGERGDQRDLLPVALGVGPALLGRVELEALQQLVPAVRVEAAAQPAEQVDGLAAGQVRPERDVAGDVREPAVQRTASRHGSPPSSRTVAGVGAEQPEQDPDGGRLARAVRAEEAVHLARSRRSRSSPSSACVCPYRLVRPDTEIGSVMGRDATLISQPCECCVGDED